MPILRKLTVVGDSRGITLPASWIKNAEQENGKKMTALALEVNGSITIHPVFEQENLRLTPPATKQEASTTKHPVNDRGFAVNE